MLNASVVRRYQKRPIIVEAIFYDGTNLDEIKRWAINNWFLFDWIKECETDIDNSTLCIKTLEGNLRCEIGTYIVKGIDGEFYPVQKNIFERSYERID